MIIDLAVIGKYVGSFLGFLLLCWLFYQGFSTSNRNGKGNGGNQNTNNQQNNTTNSDQNGNNAN